MAPALPSARTFADPVARYADLVWDRCRPAPPLLADGLDLESGHFFAWEGASLSNLASQQNFLRLLDGLDALGRAKAGERATAWIGHALEKVRDPESDLLYWGGHSAYDLKADRPLLGNHELKCAYPHYARLHAVDPEATRRFVEAFWHAHIWDAGTLLFNRHGEYESWDRQQAWGGDFAGGPLPIVENSALSFINTGSDLILAGAQLHALGGAPEPLRWALNLLSRYEQIRHPETGLAGYQFNHREPCRVRASFKGALGERPELNEVTVLTSGVIRTRYGRAAICFLNIAEALGEQAGRPFRHLVEADLEALAAWAWDEGDGSFRPLLNDGTALSPEDAVEGVGYCPPSKLQRVPADGLLFLAYARAYRLTRRESFAQMARSLARAMGWGDVLEPPNFSTSAASPATQEAWAPSGQNDACALFGLLDLHQAIGDQRLLGAAASLGQRLLRAYGVQGFFREGRKGHRASIDSALPLALVHLAAALEGKGPPLPPFYANNTYFDPKIVIRRLS